MLSAIAQLTPFGRAGQPSDDAVPWFPVVGLGLGLGLGALWWSAGQGWPDGVAAAIVVLADLAVTGGAARPRRRRWSFDVQGADGHVPDEHAADEPAGPLPRPGPAQSAAERLGPVGAALLLVRWAALAALRPSALLLAAVWCASRSWLVPLASGPVGDGRGAGDPNAGLAGSRVWSVAALGVAAGLALASVWRAGAGPVAVAAGTAVAALLAVVERRRGGPRDPAAAVCFAAETAALVVAAARW